jgi:hypothetical protein
VNDVSVIPTGDAIRAVMSIEQIERVFSTQMFDYSHKSISVQRVISRCDHFSSELRNTGRVNCKTFSDHSWSAEHLTY